MNYKYFISRIIYFIILFFSTLTIGFIIPRLIPGNPADAIIARLSESGVSISPTLLHSIESEMGISHAPVYIQYFQYLGNIFTGHFGVSISYFPEHVSTILGYTFGWTIFLILVPLVITFFAGNKLGSIAALKRGRAVDSIATGIPMFFFGFPAFALGFILMFIFSIEFPIFPSLGAYSTTLTPGFTLQFLVSVLYHAILPVATLSLTGLSGWVFGMRNNMVTMLNSNYLKYMDLMGFREDIVNRNATRNAILPNLTSFGISIGIGITGVILIQQIFSYPGMGQYLFTGIEDLDYPLVNGIFIVIILISLIANFTVEMLYGIADPRVRR